jgi:tetrahydromethanopterin S-methyltransferase subunit F
MTLASFLEGLLALMLIGFAVGVLFAWIYNSIVSWSAR